MKQIILGLGIIAIGTLAATAKERQGPRGERPQPPSASEVAARVVVDFDTDSTLSLDADELSAALTFLHENRPPPPQRRENSDTERPQRPEPAFAAMATELVIAFDADGDQQLSEAELVDTFNELHSRRGPPPPRGGRDQSGSRN